MTKTANDRMVYAMPIMIRQITQASKSEADTMAASLCQPDRVRLFLHEESIDFNQKIAAQR